MNAYTPTHIGQKLIKAVPMTRAQYNEYRGWCQPDNENGSDKGYLVEYEPDTKPNVPGHFGYVSWTPKDVFDQAYRPLDSMTFGDALLMLKRGQRVARSGWNGQNMFVFLVNGSTFSVNRPPLLGIYPEGTVINYRPHIDMRTADGQIVPWVASQSDLLAEDWYIVDVE